MHVLKQLVIAVSLLAALAGTASAKPTAEEIWEQANQATPYRPSADEFKDALP